MLAEPTPTIRVTVEVELGPEPIRGCVRAPCGADRSFCGWTALASALDWAVEQESAHAEPVGP